MPGAAAPLSLKVAGQMRIASRGTERHRLRVAGAGSILMLASDTSAHEPNRRRQSVGDGERPTSRSHGAFPLHHTPGIPTDALPLHLASFPHASEGANHAARWLAIGVLVVASFSTDWVVRNLT